MKIKKLYLPFAAFLFLISSGCVLKSNQTDGRTIAPDPVMCTQEAKECPDGSYVGRTGPNCEFAACPPATTPRPDQLPSQQDYKNWKTIIIGGVVSFQIPPHCTTDAGAGSTYVTCPTKNNGTSPPEFVFSSDGIQVNMRRHENLASPYWNDVLASMKVIQPLTHKIQINIDK